MLISRSGDPIAPYGHSSAIKIFLAGGITNCADWQSATIERLEQRMKDKNVIVYNPRKKNFDTSFGGKAEIKRQIEWEFRCLEQMDIFTMFFAKSETSVGPICLYELGRYVCRMQMRFPTDWQFRIVVDIENGYLRENDVIEQLYWATGGQIRANTRASEYSHAERIVYAVERVQTDTRLDCVW